MVELARVKLLLVLLCGEYKDFLSFTVFYFTFSNFLNLDS